MRCFIQRVSNASVTINGAIAAAINKGYLILIGIEHTDTQDDIDWFSNKICNLRIFNDEAGKMNLSIKEIGGDILLISQFTLFAQIKGNNRPSFINAAKPEFAIPIYQKTISSIEAKMGKKIFTGIFGADMQVQLINDGPVSVWIDTKNKE